MAQCCRLSSKRQDEMLMKRFPYANPGFWNPGFWFESRWGLQHVVCLLAAVCCISAVYAKASPPLTRNVIDMKTDWMEEQAVADQNHRRDKNADNGEEEEEDGTVMSIEEWEKYIMEGEEEAHSRGLARELEALMIAADRKIEASLRGVEREVEALIRDTGIGEKGENRELWAQLKEFQKLLQECQMGNEDEECCHGVYTFAGEIEQKRREMTGG